MQVVIKVGSQAILSADGKILEDVMNLIIEQIITLQNQGIKVILVSSGAVALGRMSAQKIANRVYGNTIAEKQLLASIGQPRLMAIYAKLCEEHQVMASQLLLTKYDFQTKRSYNNILRLLQKALAQQNVLTIINENDSVAIEELMFTDNDELSGIIASGIGADKLILLTSVDGVYDKNPVEHDAKLIPIIDLKDKLPEVSGKTNVGRGGMHSKLATARKMAAVGVMTHIANAHEKDVIIRLVIGNEYIGSCIKPRTRKSGVKRYLAFGSNIVASSITINPGLVRVLADEHNSVSILPVGIVSFKGEFKTGDIVEILNETGQKIGVGVARYNWQKLKEYIGGHHHPVFIHYNYLHIDYANLGAIC
jgi:glutamate 5-kinase